MAAAFSLGAAAKAACAAQTRGVDARNQAESIKVHEAPEFAQEHRGWIKGACRRRSGV